MMKVKNILSILKKQKGEIATTITLLSLGLMALGTLVGSWAVKTEKIKEIVRGQVTTHVTKIEGNRIGTVNHGSIMDQASAQKYVNQRYPERNLGVRLVTINNDIKTEGDGLIKAGNQGWEVYDKNTGNTMALIQPECSNAGGEMWYLSFDCDGVYLSTTDANGNILTNAPYDLTWGGRFEFRNPNDYSYYRYFQWLWLPYNIAQGSPMFTSWADLSAEIPQILGSHPSVLVYNLAFTVLRAGAPSGSTFEHPVFKTISCMTTTPTPTVTLTPTPTTTITATPTTTITSTPTTTITSTPTTTLTSTPTTTITVTPTTSITSTPTTTITSTPTTSITSTPTTTVTATPTTSLTSTPTTTLTPTPPTTLSCISLTTDKESYTVGENINVTANIESSSNVPVYFYFRTPALDTCSGGTGDASWRQFGYDDSPPYTATINYNQEGSLLSSGDYDLLARPGNGTEWDCPPSCYKKVLYRCPFHARAQIWEEKPGGNVLITENGFSISTSENPAPELFSGGTIETCIDNLGSNHLKDNVSVTLSYPTDRWTLVTNYCTNESIFCGGPQTAREGSGTCPAAMPFEATLSGFKVACGSVYDYGWVLKRKSVTPTPTSGQPPVKIIQLDWLSGDSGQCWTAWAETGTCPNAEENTYDAAILNGALWCQASGGRLTVRNNGQNPVDLAGQGWRRDECSTCQTDNGKLVCHTQAASGSFSGTLDPGCAITVTKSGAGSPVCNSLCGNGVLDTSAGEVCDFAKLCCSSDRSQGCGALDKGGGHRAGCRMDCLSYSEIPPYPCSTRCGGSTSCSGLFTGDACASGKVCDNLCQCVAPTNTPTPTPTSTPTPPQSLCAQSGYPCMTESYCSAGGGSNNSGICNAGNNNCGCGSDVCCGGWKSCVYAGYTCRTAADCSAGGGTDRSGVCGDGNCGCPSNEVCCSGYTACIPNGQPCSDLDSDCCSGVCVAGYCAPAPTATPTPYHLGCKYVGPPNDWQCGRLAGDAADADGCTSEGQDCVPSAAGALPVRLIDADIVDLATFNDGFVNVRDYNVIVKNYGKKAEAGVVATKYGQTGSGDVNHDGMVNAYDLSILILHIGQETKTK